MKKILLFALLCTAISFTSEAQIEQGTIYVGANSNLNFTSTEVEGSDDTNDTFSAGVTGGYFLAENFMAGLGLGYTLYKNEYIDHTTTISILARYYIHGAFFLGAAYDHMSVKNNTDFLRPDAVDSYSDSALTFQAGYAAFLNDNISIEPSINYGVGLGDYEVSQLSINVGFGIYLNR